MDWEDGTTGTTGVPGGFEGQLFLYGPEQAAKERRERIATAVLAQCVRSFGPGAAVVAAVHLADDLIAELDKMVGMRTKYPLLESLRYEVAP